MTKKLSIIVLIFALLAWINACTPCDCKQYEASSDKFKVNTVSTSFFKLEVNEDSSFSYTQQESDTMEQEKVVISIQMDLLLARQAKQRCFHLTNSAYACSCAENTFNATDPVTDLKIVTLNDFDTGHLAGSDITEYFVHLDMAYAPARIIKKSITAETIGWLNTVHGYLEPGSTGAMLYLNQVPTLGRNLHFKIVFTHRSGMQRELNTDALYLIP